MNGRFVPLGPRQIPVEEALGLGPAGIREQIKLRSDAVAGMLGWLAPSIVQDEIDLLEDELRRRGEEPDHVDVPTTPGMISAQHLAKLVMRHLADAKGGEGGRAGSSLAVRRGGRVDWRGQEATCPAATTS